MIFGGDNYSAEWHEEAERRGLPHLRDSVDVARRAQGQEEHRPVQEVRGAEQGRSSIPGCTSRYEKYVKQLTIEAETMISIARTQILPAALQHQARVAEAVAATEAAGVKCQGYAHGARGVREPGVPLPGGDWRAWRRSSATTTTIR